MPRRPVRHLALLASLCLSSLGLLAGDVSAHTSTYCGHGKDGIWTFTVWQNHILYPQWPYHQNNYKHYANDGLGINGSFLHNASTICMGGV